jgi:hypothetical protein
MLDEDEVANGNCPTLLLADSEEALLQKVHEYIKQDEYWGRFFTDNNAMDIDHMNEVFVAAESDQFIHTTCTEV